MSCSERKKSLMIKFVQRMRDRNLTLKFTLKVKVHTFQSILDDEDKLIVSVYAYVSLIFSKDRQTNTFRRFITFI